jgi:hypothetical protein
VDKHKCRWQKHLRLDLRRGKHKVYIKYSLNKIAPQYTVCLQNGKGEKVLLYGVPIKYPNGREVKMVQCDAIQPFMRFM